MEEGCWRDGGEIQRKDDGRILEGWWRDVIGMQKDDEEMAEGSWKDGGWIQRDAGEMLKEC